MIRGFEGFTETARFSRIRLIGMGGMGAVYEVEDRSSGGRLALKVMLSDDAGMLLRFKQEFRLMAELSHPNLVRLYELGQADGRFFFTMELVQGQDLQETLWHLHDQGRLPAETVALAPAEVPVGPALTHAAAPRALALRSTSAGVDTSARTEVDVALVSAARADAFRRPLACDPGRLVEAVGQVLDALEFLHGRGILHRDLKPSNILVGRDGGVRLCDFGLVSPVERAASISNEGMIIGTLAYLSPEQYLGSPASPPSDLYALGCLMFELCAGELPFQGAPRQALVGRTERPPPRLEERVREVPPALARTVLGLMAREPAERPTIDQVREGLGLRAPGRGRSRPRLPSGAGTDPTGEIFVGRQPELAAISAALERTLSGQRQNLLVSGPSGIGKSALAARAVRRAGELGFLCFRGRSYEREQVPYVAFDRVVDQLTLTLRHWPSAHLRALAPSLRVLERIFPALGMLTGPREEPAADGERADTDPRELQRRALDSFRQLVAYCQGQEPLCFVLDDLQWADEESLALLQTMQELGDGRVMVLGLFRSDGPAAGRPLEPLVQRLRAAGPLTHLALSSLEAGEAAHLVAAVTGDRLAPEVVQALASQSAGNPFLVRRLAEHLSTLAPAEQAARLAGAGTADELLGEMLEELEAPAEQVLSVAAAAGADLTVDLLKEVSGLGAEEFELARSELLSRRFLKTVPLASSELRPDGATLELYHDRVREVAYGRLTAERRRALHRGLAEALERRPGQRDRAEALVRHWGEAGDRERRRHFALAAADQALGKLAFLRAADLLRIALEEGDAAEDPLMTAARWERLGELREYGGQLVEAARAYQEAQQRWSRAPAGHPQRAQSLLRLSGRAGGNLMASGEISEGYACFEVGMALLGLPLERPLPLRLVTLVALKGRLEAESRLGLHRLLRDDEPWLAAQVQFLDWLVRAFQPIWPLPAAEAALRCELLGRRIDDQVVLQRSMAFGASVPVILGRCSAAQIDEAHARIDAAEALARSADVPLGRELAQLNRSLLWLTTDVGRARRSCEAALEGFARRGLGRSFEGAVARGYYLLVLIVKGDEEKLLEVAERERVLFETTFVNIGLALGAQAGVLARRGELAAAHAAVAEFEARLRNVRTSRPHFSCGLAHHQVLLAEGRHAEVLGQRGQMEEIARTSGIWEIGLDRSFYYDVLLEAALGMSRSGAPGRRALAEARGWARWLADRGVFDLGCLGHRALALLDHHQGQTQRARASLRRAISLSSTNTADYHRWRCLQAAREMGAITLDQETELTELGAAGRYLEVR